MGAMGDGDSVHGGTPSSSEAVILVEANMTKRQLRTN